jgi:hypothetical protein
VIVSFVQNKYTILFLLLATFPVVVEMEATATVRSVGELR